MRKELKRCPNCDCYQMIDPENLMYEAFFGLDDNNLRYSLEHVIMQRSKLNDLFESDTNINGCIHTVINDSKFEEQYGASLNALAAYSDNYQSTRYLLYPASGNEKSDFDRLRETVFSWNMGGNIEKRVKYMKVKAPKTQTAAHTGKYYQYRLQKRNPYSVYDIYVNQDIVLTLAPCCPICHCRLPEGWLTAKDYIPIGLFSPTGGGKTTLIESLTYDDFDAFRLSGPVRVEFGQLDTYAPYYYMMKNRAAELVKKHRFAPGSQIYKRLPVYLRFFVGNDEYLIGLYDIAGEQLEAIRNGDNRTKFMFNVKGIICLVDPLSLKNVEENIVEKMSGIMVSDEKNSLSSESEKKILSLEEQAELQRAFTDSEYVTIAEILSSADQTESNMTMEKYVAPDHERILETWKKFTDMFKQRGQTDNQNRMHIAMTLIKSDMLKGSELMTGINQNDDKTWTQYTEPTNRKTREALLHTFFVKNFFENKDEETKFVSDFKSVSWHAISAIGCSEVGKVQNDKIYRGEYSPIKVVEPVLECLFHTTGLNDQL